MTNSVNEINLDNADFKANPYPTYALLRENAPIYKASDHNSNTMWVVTRYKDVQAIFKDERFVKDFRNALTPEQLAGIPVSWLESREFRLFNQHMLGSDPPNHTRLRSLVSKTFTPRRIDGLKPRIEEIANQLIDQMENQTEVDLLTAYAFPLPITVIAELLGIPEADREHFRDWSNAMIDGTSANGIGFQEATNAFLGYLIEFVHKRREKLSQNGPEEGLIDSLIKAENEGEKLSEDELVSMIWLLIIAGHETTVNLIGNGMLALLQHPDQLAQLQQNPDLIKGAIEEFLRYDGPVETSTQRYAREDVEFDGQLIRRGETVLVVIAGADHDPAVFDHSEELDVTRTNNPHMAFGYGIHYCLGAPLARLEGQIAYRILLQRLPHLRLAVAPQELEWRPNALLRGLRTLPVMVK